MKNEKPTSIVQCEWNWHFNVGFWGTSCGNSWMFVNNGGLSGHGFEFCPFCGKSILEKEKC